MITILYIKSMHLSVKNLSEIKDLICAIFIKNLCVRKLKTSHISMHFK